MIKSSTISNKVYKFVEHKDVQIKTNLNCNFNSDWLKIENGLITAKGSNGNGYAWDGCSPKFNCLDLCIGTRDGRLDYNTEQPMTYYASIIHDALYQYKSQIDISRKETDIIFKLNLKFATFFWWRVYGFAVRIGGGFYGKWKKKTSQKDINITYRSWMKN